jgi:hypothetical protein
MRFTVAVALFAGLSQAIKIESDYAIWHSVAPPPPMWDVVKRGAHGFQDLNVEKAMKLNPSNAGEWPIAPVVTTSWDKVLEKPPYWAKQDWERVVKKGNSPYNDKQVEKAMQLKGEAIRVPSAGAKDKADAAEAKASEIIASENKA